MPTLPSGVYPPDEIWINGDDAPKSRVRDLMNHLLDSALGYGEEAITVGAGGTYASLNALFAALDGKRISGNGFLTIQIRNGDTALTGDLVIDHPDGDRMEIVGQTTATLPALDGLTVTGLNVAGDRTANLATMRTAWPARILTGGYNITVKRLKAMRDILIQGNDATSNNGVFFDGWRGGQLWRTGLCGVAFLGVVNGSVLDSQTNQFMANFSATNVALYFRDNSMWQWQQGLAMACSPSDLLTMAQASAIAYGETRLEGAAGVGLLISKQANFRSVDDVIIDHCAQPVAVTLGSVTIEGDLTTTNSTLNLAVNVTGEMEVGGNMSVTAAAGGLVAVQSAGAINVAGNMTVATPLALSATNRGTLNVIGNLTVNSATGIAFALNTHAAANITGTVTVSAGTTGLFAATGGMLRAGGLATFSGVSGSSVFATQGAGVRFGALTITNSGSGTGIQIDGSEVSTASNTSITGSTTGTGISISGGGKYRHVTGTFAVSGAATGIACNSSTADISASSSGSITGTTNSIIANRTGKVALNTTVTAPTSTVPATIGTADSVGSIIIRV